MARPSPLAPPVTRIRLPSSRAADMARMVAARDEKVKRRRHWVLGARDDPPGNALNVDGRLPARDPAHVAGGGVDLETMQPSRRLEAHEDLAGTRGAARGARDRDGV